MNKLTVFPICFLFLFAGIGPKKYEHSYHTGGVHLSRLLPGQKAAHAKCQLDFSILKDSIIIGRFQVIDPPSDWKIVPGGTFHGVISKINSQKSVVGSIVPGSFEWEAMCSFDSHFKTFKIAKTTPNAQGHDHFIGKLENESELGFYLE